MRAIRVSFLAIAVSLLAGVGSALQLESPSGLSVLIDVYVYQPTNFQLKKVARTSILESMELYRPESENWLVRPYKDPDTAFTQPEFRALVSWMKQEEVPGLVLDGHAEIGDEDVARLRSLPKLSLLSLRKTGISDGAMKTLAHMKSLRYLDFSETSVTAHGLALLQPQKLEKMAYDSAKITSDEFEKFQAGRKEKVALLPAEWSSVWDAARNPEPLHDPLSYFVGKIPDESIPGHLPKGNFLFDARLQLKTLDGHSVSVLSQKGQVVFLNVWTTDCGPCRSELPSLENLYQTMKDKKFFFAYVAPQSAGEVQASLDQQPRNLPVYVADAAALAPYTSGGLPTTIILSKQGEWVVHRSGPTKWDTDGIISYLNKLIDAPDK